MAVVCLPVGCTLHGECDVMTFVCFAVGCTLHGESDVMTFVCFVVGCMLYGACDVTTVVCFAVGCTLHGEDDDEHCDLRDIPLQQTFNESLFTGVWYHHYRLRYHHYRLRYHHYRLNQVPGSGVTTECCLCRLHDDGYRARIDHCLSV